MRKALFTALGVNLFVEGLTSLRLITLPRRLDDFDPTTHGGLVLYGFAALAAALSIFWFRKYGDNESSLAMGLGLLSTFHVCMVIACLMISMPPGVVGHGLLAVAFVYLFIKRRACLPVAAQ